MLYLPMMKESGEEEAMQPTWRKGSRVPRLSS